MILVGATALLVGIGLTALWNKIESTFYWENRARIWNEAITMRQTALSSVGGLEERLEQLDQSIKSLNDHTLEVLIGPELGLVKARLENLKKKFPVNEKAELASQVREQNKQLSEYGRMFTDIWREAMELHIRTDSIATQVEIVKTDRAKQSIVDAPVS